ncbi:hypothetical protein SAMN05444266_109231 [Chitinophaga jiangningensis]|uniref:Uncharacterized protein n=1 Tax=Chitinophaga jiangningensis TaxID=1419482 RepID=A0A1M7KAV3_9BACT|nr:hypothetical protein [Chitinophaga jiangningensis]SHM62400.1 hypothetical protein SAMN05444266_109231 [Chitinophaga jiangningensis]
MRKKIFLLFLLVNITVGVFAQNSKYGDEFLDWVKKDLSGQSHKLADEDVHVKWMNFFNAKSEMRLELIDYIDSTLHAIQVSMVSFEAAYDSLQQLPQTGPQQLQLAIERYEDARKNQIKLNDIGYYMLRARRIITDIDSAVTIPAFIHSGLVYAGRELLFESVLKMGNNVANTASDKFAVSASASYTESSDGSSGEWSGNANNIGSAALASMPFYYNQMVAMYGAEAAATYFPYVFVAVMAYQFYQSDQELKQMQKVFDGLHMLKDKIIQADSLHRLSNRIFYEEYEKRKPFLTQGTLFLDTLAMHWKQAIVYNNARNNAAAHILTAEKLKAIEQQYNISDSIKAIFDQSLLNEVLLYSSRSYRELQQFKGDALRGFNKSQQDFLRLDQYEQNREKLSLLVNEWISNRKLIPISSYLNFLKVQLEKDSVDVRAGLVSGHFLKDNNAALVMINKMVEKQVAKQKMKVAPVLRFQQVIPMTAQISDRPGFYYINYDGSNFGLGYSYGTYHQQLNNGGASPLTDILGSVRDGGFSTDNRGGPYGVTEIGKARSNINKRVELLQQRKQQLEEITTQWEQRNTAALTEKLAYSAKMLKQYDYNASRVMHEWGNNGSQTVNLPNVIPFRLMTTPALQQGIPGVGTIGADNPLKQILTNDGLQYEMFKRDLNITKIRLEILDYYRQGKPHPVFTSNADFESFGQRVNQVSRYASVFNDKSSSTYTKFPLQCEMAAKHHTDNLKLLRLYSQGLIPEAVLNDASVLNPELYAYEIGNMLKEFGNSCNAADANGDTPCNLYVSLALNRVYGLEGFYTTNPNGTKRYMAANEIYNYLTGDPRGWKMIGPATMQQNLYDAAFYASQGRAVVYVSPGNPHGHVAIGMPSLCEDVSSGAAYAGLKLPRVTSFFLGRPEASFYNRPISYAWSNPRDVMIFVWEPK